MKLLAAAIALFVLVVLLVLAGIFSASPDAALAGICSFSLFVHPLLWVSIYRAVSFASRKYQIIRR